MSEYDKAADVMFHAAMAVGGGSTSSLFGGLSDAIRYLCGTYDYQLRLKAIDTYYLIHQHHGDAWPVMSSYVGGRWLHPKHKNQLVLSMLFVYEFMVQDLGAQRSPADK